MAKQLVYQPLIGISDIDRALTELIKDWLVNLPCFINKLLQNLILINILNS